MKTKRLIDMPRKCVVLQFPKPKPAKKEKAPSMRCCKTDTLDWKFDGIF